MVGGGGRCYGAALWMPPTKHAAQSVWKGGPFTEVLSLSRLVLVPEVPKNGATFLMMRSVRLIRDEPGRSWRCLVTYADTWRGHTGHIYKCSGWEELGLTKPSQVWVDGSGRMVSRKAGPKTRTKKQMEELGYHLVGSFPKWRFRLVLPVTRPKREKTLFTGLE